MREDDRVVDTSDLRAWHRVQHLGLVPQHLETEFALFLDTLVLQKLVQMAATEFLSVLQKTKGPDGKESIDQGIKILVEIEIENQTPRSQIN